jgi:membrane associated rhomboid family serine protease
MKKPDLTNDRVCSIALLFGVIIWIVLTTIFLQIYDYGYILAIGGSIMAMFLGYVIARKVSEKHI